MTRWLGALIGLAGLFAAHPADAFDPARIGDLAENADFAGVILVSHGDTIIYERAFGEMIPGSGRRHDLDARWRWASITKQVIATIAMQETEAGTLDLDAPIARYWPEFPNDARDAITIRHLMQHRSGLPNPDKTPLTRAGLPAFYASDGESLTPADAYCAGPVEAEPGSRYSYNNCDFIVLGAILERVTGTPLAQLVASRISANVLFFPDGGATVPGFHFGEAEPPFRFAAYGAAGGLNGTVHDLWRFDRALMTGELLGADRRAEMWTGDPELGHAALGQWELPLSLTGCDAPVRLVERHGGIGGVQARNFILPESDMTVIAFINRSPAEFDFGQVWRGEGFAHDLLALAACDWEDGEE
ncbi:MAG: beta-lactamase family protein [Sphingomonadaceae bacterium]|nr:beta-lactamase family protein [Sphingomonadaceae bacterium]